MPALDLFWYDGGMKPRLPKEVESQNVEMAKEGILFVGDGGAILADFLGQNPRLFAKGKSEPLWSDEAATAGRSTDARRARRGSQLLAPGCPRRRAVAG